MVDVDDGSRVAIGFLAGMVTVLALSFNDGVGDVSAQPEPTIDTALKTARIKINDLFNIFLPRPYSPIMFL
jgi:hypothetical protein